MELTCTFFCDTEFKNINRVREKIKFAILSAIYHGHNNFYVQNKSLFDKLVLSVLEEINNNPFGITQNVHIQDNCDYKQLLHDSNLTILYTQSSTTIFLNSSKKLINLFSNIDSMEDRTILLKSIHDEFYS